MSKVIDLTGQRFGRLTVITYAGSNKSGKAMWRCKCDCGCDKITSGISLRGNKVLSCGCLHRETMEKSNKEKKTIHGKTHTRLYSIWRGMKKRCTVKSHEAYKRYGGRGITVCSEWSNSFQLFCEWANSNGYQECLTLDRIDVNGSYCPENCRWVSMKQQSRNKRNNHLLSFNGETHTITEWAEITGFSKDAILGRITRGWSTERTLTEPVDKRRICNKK